MVDAIRPFLMFQGAAQAAIDFYVATLPRSRVIDIRHDDPTEPGGPRQVRHAQLELAGLRVDCIDSHGHAFDFTPSVSLFVDCDDEAELRRLAAALGEGGQVMMALDGYGFSRLFTWVQDRFGVSWQLNLPFA